MSHGGGGGGEVLVIIFLAVLLFAAVMTIVWAAVGFWAYRDADSRQMDYPWLWGLAVFATGLLGVIAYFLVREEPPDDTAPAD